MKNFTKAVAFFVAFVLVVALLLGFEIPVTYAMESADGNQASNQSTSTTAVTHLTEVPEGYVGIYTKEDLNNVRNNLAGKYILMNDIEFTDADFAEGGDFYNAAAGWAPIGHNSNVKFSGIFDGNGYTISNVYIDIDGYKDEFGADADASNGMYLQ